MTFAEAARWSVHGVARRHLIERDNNLLDDLHAARRAHEDAQIALEYAQAALIDAQADAAVALRAAQDAGVVDADGDEIPWRDRQ
jgi:F0F1-type ATP synthase membrane subunit b/b'